MCVFGGCESFGGCKPGMNLPPNPMLDKVGGFGEQKPAWREAAMMNALSMMQPIQIKEHPSWWLTQADIDRLDHKPEPTIWQRFWAWWRK